MGTPENPENGDAVTLFGADGLPHGFTVDFVDDELVTCSSESRVEVFTRDQFAALFGEGGA